MSLKHLLMALVLVFGAASADAQEPPLLNGTFTIKVYWGQGGGNGNNAQVQALESNPLITGEPLATVTYVGSLNFRIGADGLDTIGAFFASGTRTSISGLDETTAARIMSTPPFANTTVLDITFNSGAISDGNTRHDDGIGLYVNGSLVTPTSAAAPTARDSHAIHESGGQLSADLRCGQRQAPGSHCPRHAGGHARLRRTSAAASISRRPASSGLDFVLPATGAEKFCPDTNSGALKLGCSGELPDDVSVVAFTSGTITCLISGSQCEPRWRLCGRCEIDHRKSGSFRPTELHRQPAAEPEAIAVSAQLRPK